MEGADLADLLGAVGPEEGLSEADLAATSSHIDLDGGEDLAGAVGLDLPDFDLAGGAGFGAGFLVDLTTVHLT